jgi:hypothetical protein
MDDRSDYDSQESAGTVLYTHGYSHLRAGNSGGFGLRPSGTVRFRK